MSTPLCDCCGQPWKVGHILEPGGERVCTNCFEFLTRYSRHLSPPHHNPSSDVLTLAFAEAELL